MSKAPSAPPRPLRSGWCNVSIPLDHPSHRRCSGTVMGHHCPCPHHTQESTVPDLDPGPAADLDPGPAADLDQLTLDQAVDLFTAAADRLSEAAKRDLMGTHWVDAVKLLDRLRTAVRTAGQVDATLVRHIYLTGEHGRSEIGGVGLISVTRSRDRTHWDERGVARAVIDAHMAETTGEAPDPWTVTEWLLEVYGVNYCRVTPLRALGLEPKAFCDEEPGKPVVQLPPRT